MIAIIAVLLSVCPQDVAPSLPDELKPTPGQLRDFCQLYDRAFAKKSTHRAEYRLRIDLAVKPPIDTEEKWHFVYGKVVKLITDSQKWPKTPDPLIVRTNIKFGLVKFTCQGGQVTVIESGLYNKRFANRDEAGMLIRLLRKILTKPTPQAISESPDSEESLRKWLHKHYLADTISTIDQLPITEHAWLWLKRQKRIKMVSWLGSSQGWPVYVYYN